MKHVLTYPKEPENKKKSFMNQIVAHAKEIPAPTKYSKVITWAVPDHRTTGITRAKRVTLFAELSKSAKGQPGPATYKKEKSIERTQLERTKGVYKR